MKMSDVFPKGYELTFDYCPSHTGTEETFGFIFTSSEPCVFICDAVNGHDKLLEENKKLREALSDVDVYLLDPEHGVIDAFNKCQGFGVPAEDGIHDAILAYLKALKKKLLEETK